MSGIKKLLKFGYSDTITYENEQFQVSHKEITLTPTSLFFIDVGIRVDDTYIFALSSPIYEVKGQLSLDHEAYSKIMASEYTSKFEIDIIEEPKEIIIRRQYGMRKILKSEFDPSRYILRKGFPDFPACPYGHTFKMLGYDRLKNEYVRLASSILKEASLEKIEYKE